MALLVEERPFSDIPNSRNSAGLDPVKVVSILTVPF
jgi:hypothetical protein